MGQVSHSIVTPTCHNLVFSHPARSYTCPWSTFCMAAVTPSGKSLSLQVTRVTEELHVIEHTSSWHWKGSSERFMMWQGSTGRCQHSFLRGYKQGLATTWYQNCVKYAKNLNIRLPFEKNDLGVMSPDKHIIKTICFFLNPEFGWQTLHVIQVVSTIYDNIMYGTGTVFPCISPAFTSLPLQVRLTWGGKRCSQKELLNNREAKGVKFVIQKYKQLMGGSPTTDDDLFVFLGDTPSKRLRWSAKSRRLPTFRRNGGKMFHIKSQSWMTSRDKLASLGYPVSESVARAMGVPVIPVRDRIRAASVAGNSFHFATASCVQIVAMCCYKMIWFNLLMWLCLNDGDCLFVLRFTISVFRQYFENPKLVICVNSDVSGTGLHLMEWMSLTESHHDRGSNALLPLLWLFVASHSSHSAV